MIRFNYPGKMKKSVLKHLQKTLVRDKIIVGETRARIAAVLLCFLLDTSRASTVRLLGYTNEIEEAFRLFNTEEPLLLGAINRVANELRAKGYLGISEKDAECFYIEDKGTEFVLRLKRAIEKAEDHDFRNKLTDDQKDVLKVLKKVHDSDPGASIITADIMHQTKMESFWANKAIKQLEKYGWVEILNKYDYILTRRGLNICKQLFPTEPATQKGGFEWLPPLGLFDDSPINRKLFEKLNDRSESFDNQPYNDYYGASYAGYNSGYTDHSINIGQINTGNLVIGKGGSININTASFFRELEHLVQESEDIPLAEKPGILAELKDIAHHQPDHISEAEKPGIWARLKGLTYHPIVIALAQKAFEMGIKGGA